MNLWKVKNPRKDLRFEIAFTKAYRDAVRTYTHPAQIELACLKAQYPAIMMPIEDDDVLAGRIQMGLVGMAFRGRPAARAIILMSRASRRPLSSRAAMQNTEKTYMTC